MKSIVPMRMSWDQKPAKPVMIPCANCGRAIPGGRRGDYFASTGNSKSDIVCSNACGNELVHRIARAVPGVFDLLSPDERSSWRNYKAGR